jgi:hypothetical protein
MTTPLRTPGALAWRWSTFIYGRFELDMDTHLDLGPLVQVATAALGVSRQTVLQRVKRGELHAVHIRTGRRKGLRIELPAPQEGLF